MAKKQPAAAASVPLVERGALVPYINNSRTHSPDQVGQIAGSIDQFGMVGAIVIRNGTIAKGHGTLQAINKLYDAGKLIYPAPGQYAEEAQRPEPYPAGMVPVIDASGWSDAQFKAYVIADNKIAENSGWDVSLLKLEITDLQDEEVDLVGLLGFSDKELGELLKPEALDNGKDPDAAPDLPAVPHSVPGDVWVLGPHKIMCGDSCSVDAWTKLMCGEMADICWTDPPYNVAYESKLAGAIKNDDMDDSAFRQFLVDAHTALFMVMKPGAAIYVAHADTEGLNFRAAFAAAGFKMSGCLIWQKDSLVLGRSDYQWMHEPILYGWKPGSAHKWYGGRKNTTVVTLGYDSPFTQQEDGSYAIRVGDRVLRVSADAVLEESPSTVIYHAKPKRSAEHPTMKPVELVERMLKHNARTGDLVVDAFSGSGTTLMAAERLGMCARVMELDPKFVDVCVKRWQNYTGRRALHAVSGEPFPEGPEAE